MPDIRRLIRMTLEFEDCEIHEAADAVVPAGNCALRLQPDVVLLDVMMPGELDGLDLCLR
jgi:CheY-like chemotaxis protein